MPHAGHFGVKSAAKRNRMARNKARAKQVSDTQFSDNWDKILEVKMPRKKTTKKKSKSRVNEAGNYTKPTMRKRLFEKIKAGSKGGKPGQWSARKAQLLASEYKKKGGGYK